MVDKYKCLETAAKEPVSSATAAATWSVIKLLNFKIKSIMS